MLTRMLAMFAAVCWTAAFTVAVLLVLGAVDWLVWRLRRRGHFRR